MLLSGLFSGGGGGGGGGEQIDKRSSKCVHYQCMYYHCMRYHGESVCVCCQCLHYHLVNLCVVSVCTITNSQPECCQCLHYHQQSTCVLSVSPLSPTVNMCVVSVSTTTNSQPESCQCVIISVCVSVSHRALQVNSSTDSHWHCSAHTQLQTALADSAANVTSLKNTGGESKATGFLCPKLFCFLHPVQAVARC